MEHHVSIGWVMGRIPDTRLLIVPAVVLGGVDNRVELVVMGEPCERGKIFNCVATRGRGVAILAAVVWVFN